MLADTDVLAYLYPGVGTDGYKNSKSAIEENGEAGRFPYVEATNLEEGVHALDGQPYLKIPFRIPRGSHGVEFGTDSEADLTITEGASIVSNRHFSLTFNDDYYLIVKDLGSTRGTSVMYGAHEGGMRTNFEWIIGGHDFVSQFKPIIIRVSNDLQFIVKAPPFNRNSTAFRTRVDTFKKGSGGLEHAFHSSAVIRPPTEPSTVPDTRQGEFVIKIHAGEGTYANVWHGFNVRTGQEIAIKVPKNPADFRSWRRERDNFSNLSHDHIVRCLGVLERPRELHLEWLSGGSLHDALAKGHRFSTVESLHITRQITSALAYLHERQITHRDISTGNILIGRRDRDGIVVKLADLGLSKMGSHLNSNVGTRPYQAPEFGHSPLERYTNAVDIWSLGVVMTNLICRLPQFTSLTLWNGVLWCEAVRERLRQHLNTTANRLALFVMDYMLCMEPEKRRSALECHQRSLILCESIQDGEAATPTGGEESSDYSETATDSRDFSALSEDSDGAATPRPSVSVSSDTPTVSPQETSSESSTASSLEMSSDWSAASPQELSSDPPIESPQELSSDPPITSPQEIIQRLCDYEDSLFCKSDLFGDSKFSESFELVPGSTTPRPASLVEGSAPHLGNVVHASQTEGSARLDNKNAVGATAAPRGSASVVPQKRTRLTDSDEDILLPLKNFLHEPASRSQK